MVAYPYPYPYSTPDVRPGPHHQHQHYISDKRQFAAPLKQPVDQAHYYLQPPHPYDASSLHPFVYPSRPSSSQSFSSFTSSSSSSSSPSSLSPSPIPPPATLPNPNPKHLNDLRVHLLHRLRDGNFDGGFPLQRNTVDPRGRATISKEYDIPLVEFGPAFGSRVWIGFKGPKSSSRDDQRRSASASQYFTWQAYYASGSPRESRSRSRNHVDDSKPPSSRTILAQVRVDPAIMHTSYGKFLRTDPRAISRALAISLELGVLITIVAADEKRNTSAGSARLAKLTLATAGTSRHQDQHRYANDGFNELGLDVDLDYWVDWNSCGYEYGSGYGCPPELGLGFGFEDAGRKRSRDQGYSLSKGITQDSILYIGTRHDGSSELLYTYPN
ncbi:hypothetical protein GYMLUDRAFT_76842 [Collybiopsis luxurians FD-317 M1]|uniref:Uncharacterized protein n=1 Tax=Collybiopsis luxurians FD-317 M1 TaxID=944289 RepID=A0A0D0AW66_9AGAR|nr:hypothetical protein GYMLUDRAFT_76842 [Collybiopsis luxurians FD-317 M1]